MKNKNGTHLWNYFLFCPFIIFRAIGFIMVLFYSCIQAVRPYCSLELFFLLQLIKRTVAEAHEVLYKFS